MVVIVSLNIKGSSLNPCDTVETRKEIDVENQFYVGWGTLALINAGLSQGKNRSGLNWFLVSLLLGPIATLFLLFQEKLPKE